jgi:hypothetical protein
MGLAPAQRVVGIAVTALAVVGSAVAIAGAHGASPSLQPGGGAGGGSAALSLPRITASAYPADQQAPGAQTANQSGQGVVRLASAAQPDSAAQADSAAQPVGSPPRQLFVPDLIAALPTGISKAELTRIGKLAGVRATLPLSGGQVLVGGKPANVIGVAPQAFRDWTPPQTAASVQAWAGLSQGDLLATTSAVKRLGLSSRSPSQVSGATQVNLPLGAAVQLGVPGVDAAVDSQRAAQLGLIGDVAVLINAPGADLSTLMAQIRSVIGSRGKVVNLVPVVVVSKLPVTSVPVEAGQVPSNYLQLYQDSAAEYCPGLSWTVLAAIGEIESGDGANDGPSSAGALGPMQFIPSTWAIWGIDGFGQTGTPDIMNPLDAVPSAARMLCDDGAADGASGLSAAIFDYNHATWYVSEVLQLATEYAASYG